MVSSDWSRPDILAMLDYTPCIANISYICIHVGIEFYQPIAIDFVLCDLMATRT